jgi:hypothetical protein
VHVPSNVTTELSLCVSPRGQTQQMGNLGLDNASPTHSLRGQYRERPVTPTPSPRRTAVSGRAAARNRPDSADVGEAIFSAFENSRRTAAAAVIDDQTPTEDPPVVDNLLVNIGGPDPVYPRQVGVRHPEDPLPMIPRSPKKYYNIYRGLRIGVFYDVWYFLSFEVVPLKP